MFIYLTFLSFLLLQTVPGNLHKKSQHNKTTNLYKKGKSQIVMEGRKSRTISVEYNTSGYFSTACHQIEN